jgi:hypothetical protein
MMRRTALAAVASTVLACAGGAARATGDPEMPQVQPAAPPHHAISWLSTGDSYSSGEGIDSAGTGTDYCAQSSKAYGPTARNILASQLGWRMGATAFTACTGHLLGDFYNAHTPGRGSLWDWTQQQTTPNQQFDVVTFSFGGNDIGFADTLVGCLEGQITRNWNDTPAPDKHLCSATPQNIQNSINKMVEGYPTAKIGNRPANLYGPHNTHQTLAQFYETWLTTRSRPAASRWSLVIRGCLRHLARGPRGAVAPAGCSTRTTPTCWVMRQSSSKRRSKTQ